jgi:hypothetical protein
MQPQNSFTGRLRNQYPIAKALRRTPDRSDRDDLAGPHALGHPGMVRLRSNHGGCGLVTEWFIAGGSGAFGDHLGEQYRLWGNQIAAFSSHPSHGDSVADRFNWSGKFWWGIWQPANWLAGFASCGCWLLFAVVKVASG